MKKLISKYKFKYYAWRARRRLFKMNPDERDELWWRKEKVRRAQEARIAGRLTSPYDE